MGNKPTTQEEKQTVFALSIPIGFTVLTNNSLKRYYDLKKKPQKSFEKYYCWAAVTVEKVLLENNCDKFMGKDLGLKID